MRHNPVAIRAAVKDNEDLLTFEFGEYGLIELPTGRIILRPIGTPAEDQDYVPGDLYVLYLEEGRLIIDDYIPELKDPALREVLL